MKEILYIEDNPEMALLVQESLKPNHVFHAATLREADLFLRHKSFDLILLDLNLPDGDGLKFLAEKYNDQSLSVSKTPLFVISAQGDISNKVLAFAIGADDYILKPFHTAELKARVEAKLRKNNDSQLEQEIQQLANVTLNLAKQSVSVRVSPLQEESLQLTRLEFKLLAKFMKSPERVFSREYLIESIWGDDTNITDRTVDTHVAHLRKKLANADLKIETVTGEGYRLRARPTSHSVKVESQL